MFVISTEQCRALLLSRGIDNFQLRPEDLVHHGPDIEALQGGGGRNEEKSHLLTPAPLPAALNSKWNNKIFDRLLDIGAGDGRVTSKWV